MSPRLAHTASGANTFGAGMEAHGSSISDSSRRTTWTGSAPPGV
ncbi:hypothetical protein [Candidatus Palauibacter irciniicola]